MTKKQTVLDSQDFKISMNRGKSHIFNLNYYELHYVNFKTKDRFIVANLIGLSFPPPFKTESRQSLIFKYLGNK